LVHATRRTNVLGCAVLRFQGSGRAK
jgi:hypothetical protein